MKIYIDVTSLMSVKFITGIQRVVREVVTRMLHSNNFEIVLLNYNENNSKYVILNNEKFIEFFDNNIGSKSDIFTASLCDVNDISNGSVFFDIDSVWMSKLKRSYLLPILKSKGVRIAVQVYDIIPVTHPQYCHQNTTFWFMSYLGAQLKYADIIIVSTQATLEVINELTDKLGVKRINGVVVPLGSDFKDNKSTLEKVDDKAAKIANSGKYLLMVGTIEPRKNHKILIDAYDKYLYNTDISIIIAGRIGWNVEGLVKRIKSHDQFNKKIFHIMDANDATIDYLYRNAFYVVFPTYDEGFGLPLIESIERGTPVIASNIDVLKEVGKDFCDYFDPDDAQELAKIVINDLTDLELYNKKKDRTTEFVSFTWDQSTQMMIETIDKLKNNTKVEIPKVKQMVVLSARADDLLSMIPFVENLMTFITEMVICCPDSMVDLIKAEYKGDLNLLFLTDTVILNGNELPEDHTKRNFFLRCLALSNDVIDDVFIMSDDDYRPLVPIDNSVFIKDDRYLAYYYYHLEKWPGNPSNMSSFDFSMIRTYEFLSKNQYPTLQYSSHMPQIIDKRIYSEMLNKHPDIISQGLDEWSTYFNYCSSFYPSMIEIKPYISMCWPGRPTDWELDVVPNEYLFENYYSQSYEQGGIFEGFKTFYYDGIINENIKKVTYYMKAQLEHQQSQRTWLTYQNMYSYIYKQYPSITIIFKDRKCMFEIPEFIMQCERGCNKIQILCKYLNHFNVDDFPFRLEYCYKNSNNEIITQQEGIDIQWNQRIVELPLFSLGPKGEYLISFKISSKNNICYEEKVATIILIE